MAIRTIVHFEIPAANVERLSRFYHACFGWKFKRVRTPGFDYWLITTGPLGKSLGGGMYPRSGPEDRPRNFVAVDRIDPAIRKFTAAGGTQLVGKMEVPGMGRSFIGADPEGNVIALWEPAMTVPSRPRGSVRRRPTGGRRKALRGRR